MVSILLTSFKEPNTIYEAIKNIGDVTFSGIEDNFEIIQISPDKATLDEGQRAANDLNLGTRYSQIIDPQKGKPFALNLGFAQAKGEVLVLTDGDVALQRNALLELLKPFEDDTIGGVTGQPVPQNSRKDYWGYLAHCFTAAADHKRKNDFPKKISEFYVSEGNFFPLSGYILAIRNIDMRLPKDLALDDTYISYYAHKEGYKLAYTPNAKASVKFPTNYHDYIKQRRRNLAGHIDLKKHAELIGYKNERSFIDEVKYALFPISYAKGLKELIWSLTMYPLRLITWFYVASMRLRGTSIMKKGGWERIGSTK